MPMQNFQVYNTAALWLTFGVVVQHALGHLPVAEQLAQEGRVLQGLGQDAEDLLLALLGLLQALVEGHHLLV